MRLATWTIVCLATSLCACGSTVAPPEAPGAAAPAPGAEPGATEPEDPEAARAEGGAPAAQPEPSGPKPLGPFPDTPHPALEPLDASEQKALAADCKAMAERLSKAAVGARKGSRVELTDLLIDALPPERIKADRCASLLRRDLLAYRARLMEMDAARLVKTLAVLLDDALRSSGRLCPSAPPVPASIDSLKDGPAEVSAASYAAEGWRCLGYVPTSTTQLAQLELESAADTGRYRIIARVVSVRGAEPTTLVLEGVASDGGVDPGQPILRY